MEEGRWWKIDSVKIHRGKSIVVGRMPVLL
jgi:hypothetical protein